MGKNETTAEFLVRLKTAFDETSPEAIDMDSFLARLDELISIINHNEKISTELSQLREDYQNRITGMLKAMAVAKNNDDEMRLVLDEIEELEKMPASLLLAKYKKVQTRFRVSFPASFGQLAQRPFKSKLLDNKNYQ